MESDCTYVSVCLCSVINIGQFQTKLPQGEVSHRIDFLHLLINVSTPPEKKSERQACKLLGARTATQSRARGKESEALRENGVPSVPSAEKVSNRAYTSPDSQHRSKGKRASCGPVKTDVHLPRNVSSC